LIGNIHDLFGVKGDKVHINRDSFKEMLLGSLDDSSSDAEVMEHLTKFFNNNKSELHTQAVDVNPNYFRSKKTHSRELNKAIEAMEQQDYFTAIECVQDYLEVNAGDKVFLSEFEKYVMYTAITRILEDNKVIA